MRSVFLAGSLGVVLASGVALAQDSPGVAKAKALKFDDWFSPIGAELSAGLTGETVITFWIHVGPSPTPGQPDRWIARRRATSVRGEVVDWADCPKVRESLLDLQSVQGPRPLIPGSPQS